MDSAAPKRVAREAEQNTPLRALARGGYAANGLVHILIGIIALVVAFGGDGATDQSGALMVIAAAPLGFVGRRAGSRRRAARSRSRSARPRGAASPQPSGRADGWVNAREIATGDPAVLPTLPAKTTPQDAAAWTLVSRVLLNLDETITKN